jgi:hypothetical protein
VWCMSECDRETSIMRRALAHWGVLRQGQKKIVPMNSSFLIIPTDFEIIEQINFCVISYYENCQDDFYNAWYRRPLTILALSYLPLTERRKFAVVFFFKIRHEVHLNCRNIHIFRHTYLPTLNTNLLAANRPLSCLL